MAFDVSLTLRRAISDLEAQRDRMDRQIAAVRGALGVGGAGTTRTAGARRRKPMSAAARALVSRRMKAYWAKRRASKKGSSRRK